MIGQSLDIFETPMETYDKGGDRAGGRGGEERAGESILPARIPSVRW